MKGKDARLKPAATKADQNPKTHLSLKTGQMGQLEKLKGKDARLKPTATKAGQNSKTHLSLKTG
jgi:hypothetical protein